MSNRKRPAPLDDTLVAANVPAMTRDDPFPGGPYRMGLTKYHKGSGPIFTSAPPWVIHAANGQCICGWIDSRECAVAIEAALNAQFPAPVRRR